jgi:hypothetical protein
VIGIIRGVGRNFAAIIGMFAVALPAFVVCTVLFSVGVSLASLSSRTGSGGPLQPNRRWPPHHRVALGRVDRGMSGVDRTLRG